MGTLLIICILLITINPHRAYSVTDNTLTEGSSLSVDQPGVVLTSPNGVFSAGFFPVGLNAYCFAIWFNDPNRTVVWTANRDFPVNGKASKLILLKSGNLVLTDGGITVIWTTETSSKSPTELRLQNSGNLVLSNSLVLWQSFDDPTDTILPNQPLNKNAKLVSSRALANLSSGFYRLFFDTDNVLRLTFDNGQLSSVYWPFPWQLTWQAGRSTYNNSKTAVLDSLGNFSSSDDFTFRSLDYGERNTRRLKLDHDGNVRLYSWHEDTWVVTWQAFSNPCRIHGACGPNSVCEYELIGVGKKCSCIEGHKMRNFSDWSYGCEPEFELSCERNESRFLKIPNSEFYGYDYGVYYNYTLRACENLCLKVCQCKGFQYSFYAPEGGFRCFPKMSLNNGYTRPGFSGSVYIRLPKTKPYNKSNLGFINKLNCSAKKETVYNAREYVKRRANETVNFVLWFTLGVGVLEAICIFFTWSFLIRTRTNSNYCDDTRAFALAATGFRRFSFAELKKATTNFSQEIGRGAGGVVYKGVLSDSRPVAVKKLDQDSDQCEAEFLAEVNTIGSVNHMNLIEMFGYCAEGNHRLLVYEYMERGSLKDNIILSEKALDSQKRFKIAVGMAKGLAYLHDECLEWVLHCDVKPQNILLSSDYHPKVSDFGLSKLLKRGETNSECNSNSNDNYFSRIRGTRGYMAPEWVTNKPITSKVDVYSYGVVLLEMLTGKSPVYCCDGGAEKSLSNRGLVGWVKESVSDHLGEISEVVLEKIVDPAILGGELCDIERMGILLRVALCCVEEEKDERPSMRQVVEMLQDRFFYYL